MIDTNKMPPFAATNFDKKTKYPVDEVPHGSFFSLPAYVDERFILAAPEMQLSPRMLDALHKWEFEALYSEGRPMKEYIADSNTLSGTAELAEASRQADDAKLKQAKKFFAWLMNYTDNLFMAASMGRRLDFKVLANDIKRACGIIRDERRFLLRLMRDVDGATHHSHLISHSVKTMVLSVIVGNQMKIAIHRLIELGVSALFHDIGMILIPPELYLTERTLSANEFSVVKTHTTMGFNLLSSFHFPLDVSLPALEHQEKENGKGYPCQLSGDRISLYSKIVSVVSSYEAISSKRPHRDAKEAHLGVLELLRNHEHGYNEDVIRAFIRCLSIYPIGTPILLSNGHKGQVLDVNPELPRYPIVQVFGELTPDGKNKVVQTSKEGVSIVRPLLKTEISHSS